MCAKLPRKERLDNLLLGRKLTVSRTLAAAQIMAGQVKVDGKLVTKPGHQVSVGSILTLLEGPRYVSRGGLKLEPAAAKFKLNFKNKVVLDVGSSTGGFTDFALQQGAKKVYAVDVGTNQLDFKLRQDERVEVMEKTDIRAVDGLPHAPATILIDVSFISMRLVLPAVAKLASRNTQIVAMVKPQFEAGKQEAAKNRGVIKNDTIRRRILKEFELWAKRRFVIKAKADSLVAGAKGNVERFYLLKPLK